jgi:SAM-dependent methyltransferase
MGVGLISFHKRVDLSIQDKYADDPFIKLMRLRSIAGSILRGVNIRLRAFVSSNTGYCHCCRQQTRFVITGPWLRDQYFCRTCHSIPRQRHINFILDRHYPDWENKEIHESSPGNKFISQWANRYSSSQYYEGVQEGALHNGHRCENLEHLTYPDETFDIFITQDVLEHVFHPDKAIQEIMRVLKPGGVHIFTTPKHKNLVKSYARAVIENGEIKHLLEPMYHGNPVGDGRALVTWDYGDDFEALIRNWCGYPTITYATREQALGLDGEYPEVFVTHKITK